jgi:hypothetical protein
MWCTYSVLITTGLCTGSTIYTNRGANGLARRVDCSGTYEDVTSLIANFTSRLA